MSDARRYAVWPEPRSRSRSLKGSRPSVPHGTNFFTIRNSVYWICPFCHVKFKLRCCCCLWLVGWLTVNGTLSTNRLYRAIVVVYNISVVWELCFWDSKMLLNSTKLFAVEFLRFCPDCTWGRTFWHFHSPHFTSPRLVPPFLWIDLRNLFIAKNADMALLKTTLATRLCCSPVLCHWQAIARC